MKKTELKIKDIITLKDKIHAIEAISDSCFVDGDYTPYFLESNTIEYMAIYFIEGFELEVKHLDGFGRMLLHKNNPTGYTECVVLRFRYIHELFDFLEIHMPSINLEWKGVQK